MIRSTWKPASRPASCVAATCRSPKYAGTVITARWNTSPERSSASSLSRRRMIADSSIGVYARPLNQTLTSPSWPGVTR